MMMEEDVKNIRVENWHDLPRTIYNWGVNDVNYKTREFTTIGYIEGKQKQKLTKICPYYRDWINMINRVFSKRHQSRFPKYRGCSINEKWRYLSNFIYWVDSQPNREWQICSLDKDFLVSGNKVYSPELAIYIPNSLNSFILDCGAARGEYMIGVARRKDLKTKPFCASCDDPFKISKSFIGYYATELQAHLAWKEKKHEYALKLADMQSDNRIAERLREMYCPESDWTKR